MEMMNIDSARSYATRENLTKALADFPNEWRYIVVKNTEGRFTAIFPVSFLGGNVTGPARRGFPVVG